MLNPARNGDPSATSRAGLSVIRAFQGVRRAISTLRSRFIGKLFAEDDVRVYEPKLVRFHCPCTNERAEQSLQLLGRADIEELLEERGTIEVICEYCRVERKFDAVDVSRLFAENVVDGPGSVQ